MIADVLILGAGPAGVALALLLTARGYSVEVVDSAFFPRPKICGEFLNPQAVRWLQDQHLLDFILAARPFPIHGMKVTDTTGVSFTGHYLESNGYAILRKDFDALLLNCAEKSGIKVSQGYSARRLLFDGENVCGVKGMDAAGEPFEKKARIVVGADGRNNLIGRTFGWMKQVRDLRKYAFLTYFNTLPDLENFGEIHLIQDGYIGIAPLNDEIANVALVVDEILCPSWDEDPAAFLMRAIQSSRLAERFKGIQPITSTVVAGPLAFEMKQTSGYRTLVVGDACGFIDPFTGEGINYAFLSADIAADVLDAAFRAGNLEREALAVYDYRRRHLLARKFRIARLFQKTIPHPALSKFLIARFANNRHLGDSIVSVVGSAVPVEEVWKLSFLLRLAVASPFRRHQSSGGQTPVL